jgi:hypothetical protein
MADNIAVTPGVGATVAADLIDGALHQRVKLSVGADGTAADLAPGQAAMAASLPVTIANNQSDVPITLDSEAVVLGAGTALIGKVGIDQATANANEVVVKSGTVTTVSTVTAVTGITNALPAGTNAIGKLAANHGVDIGDVDIASGPTGANAIQIQGTVASGSAAANNPVLLGLKAVSALPAVVDANDVTPALSDLRGRQIVVLEAPNDVISVGTTASITDNAATQVLAAAGNNTKWRITAIGIYNAHATVGTWVKVQDDTGTPVVYWRGYAAAVGGGFNLNFSPALPASGQANGKINVIAETTGASFGASVCAFKVPE